MEQKTYKKEREQGLISLRSIPLAIGFAPGPQDQKPIKIKDKSEPQNKTQNLNPNPKPNRSRGRPRSTEPRLHAVTCRLTDAELARCEASRGALTAGEWLRVGALSALPPAPPPALNLSAWQELSRAASNLNQIAKKVSSQTNNLSSEIEDIRAALADFRAQLIGARL